MTKLILIGGAPGIGKSTVARLLMNQLPNSAWLDGDDVWRMNPFRVDAVTTAMVQHNIAYVLRGFIEAGFSYAILSWVMHRQIIIDQLLDSLQGLSFQALVCTLVCSPAALAERHRGDPARSDISQLALDRLEQSRQLKTLQIDTDGLSAGEVAARIRAAMAAES